MSRKPKALYDSQQFKDEWYSDMPLADMAEKYGVAKSSLSQAARRRGYSRKYHARHKSEEPLAWSNPKQPKAPKDPEYLGYVKQLPCVICAVHDEPYGQAPSDAHHPISGRHSQVKSPDHEALPFCKPHHQTGGLGKPSIHLHRVAFHQAYGPDTRYIKKVQKLVKDRFGYVPFALRLKRR